MHRMAGLEHPWLWPGLTAAVVVFAMGALAAARDEVIALDDARIFIEYNASAHDLGFHVSVAGEDWRRLEISNPHGRRVLRVEGRGAFAKLGSTELLFDGAEPPLEEVAERELLARFPAGPYGFEGRSVDGEAFAGMATLTHAVPAAPAVSAELGADGALVIRWEPVAGPAPGFEGPIRIVGYRVIVDRFEVTLPASSTRATVPPELVASLVAGRHGFEVLAIDASGNRTIARGSFSLASPAG